MFCHVCGTQVAPESRFCTRCGAALDALPSPSAPVAWTALPGIRSRTGHWIGEGWRLVQADLGNYVLAALLFLLLSSVPLIGGTLVAGFHVFCMKKMTNRPADIAALFAGFNFFIPTLVASLLIGLFVFLGTLALIIPGIVIAAMYKFTFLFIVDKRMDFWPAMQASHSVVRNDYFGFSMFLITLTLINILGAICLFVGLLITVPVTIAAITVAYKEIVGFEPHTIASL